MRGRLDEHYRVHNDKLVRKRMLDQQQYRYSDDAEERDVQVEDQRGGRRCGATAAATTSTTSGDEEAATGCRSRGAGPARRLASAGPCISS